MNFSLFFNVHYHQQRDDLATRLSSVLEKETCKGKFNLLFVHELPMNNNYVELLHIVSRNASLLFGLQFYFRRWTE